MKLEDLDERSGCSPDELRLQIAERERAELELRQSEQRYRQMFEKNQAIKLLIDPSSGAIVDANPAACTFYGYTRAQLRQISITDINTLARQEIAAEMARAAEEERSYFLFRHRLASGAVRDVEVHSSPVDVGGGRHLLYSIIHDITERRQAEEAVRMQKSLLEAQGEASPDGVLAVSPEGRILSFNRRFVDMWRLSDEILATRSDEAALGAVLDQLADPEEFLARVAHLYAHPDETSRETIALRDGRTFDRHSAPARGSDGSHYGRVWFFRDITERQRAENMLQFQASHDVLTGLPNRALLRDRIEALVAPASPCASSFALLLLDLDRFKEVNDTLGHRSGDLLLQQVGPRLAARLNECDTLARLGGDEFAILLPGADAAAARATAEQLVRALEESFDLDGADIELGGSIGIALHPDHGGDADSLLRRADVAMYAAKDARSGFATYAADQDRHSPERLALLADLRRGIDHGELLLHYQPQVDVRSGVPLAVEALVRWMHPVRGFVLPDQFIPAAERSRLIRPLSRWVLRTALRECAAWSEAGLDLPVSVNLSAHDLQDPTLPHSVASLLASWGIAPDRLRVEITESSLMVDPPRTREILAQLRARGVQIAIDDFGTGYSSLAYLKDLPVDELKIDKSFVRDMAVDESARAIVRAIIDLADDLRLRVVAEGVEDQATWAALVSLGCRVAQGYLFSHPLPTGEIANWARGAVRRGTDQDQIYRAAA